MSATLGLEQLPGRCQTCAYHVATQGHGSECSEQPSEWHTFTAALRTAVRDDGTVHACDVRPLVRGRIEPKHIGQSWRRARNEGLLVEVGHERSDDDQGRNRGRMEPYYELRTAA